MVSEQQAGNSSVRRSKEWYRSKLINEIDTARGVFGVSRYDFFSLDQRVAIRRGALKNGNDGAPTSR